jgi:hypothetical protein
VTAAVVEVIERPDEGGPSEPSGRAFLALLVALVSLPLAVAVVALRRPVWAPVLDLAMTEVRVRDVGTSHSPLIGLPGRIGGNGIQGSHPGPLSFWLLAPVYRLAGSTAWGLQLATAVLDLVAISLALVLADRRGGRLLAGGVALALAVLVVGYGPAPLLEPWNPYLPLLWWCVALLAVWSVLCGDLVALPVLVVAGTLCAQTHVPYLALALGLGGLAVAGVLAAGRWGLPPAARRGWWLAIAGVIGVALWLPPTIDQLVNDPGNYRVLIDHFGTPPEEPVGISRAAEEVLDHFDLGHLVVDQARQPGLLARGELGRFPVPWRGALLVVTWLGCAAVAWRRSPASLRALHATLGAATVLGWYSISRIFGVVWYYLMLWLWAVAALAVLATVWSLVVLLRQRAPGGEASRRLATSARWAAPALLVLVAVVSLRTLLVAPDAEPSDPQLSRVLTALVEPTAGALDDGTGPAPGPDAQYIVGFSDALHIGSQAYGLVSELERLGYDVGMDPAFAVPMTEHRTIEPEDADARIQLVTGVNIDAWRSLSGAVEVATVDLRTDEELEELAALRASVIERLEQEGLGELVQYLDTNLFRAAIDQRASERLRVDMDRMLKIGMPTSVFLAPATTTGP